MVYIKRTVMSFKMNGQPRRGLFWKKEVYKLWFEYAKISPLPIPKEFGDLTQFDDFEDWWKHPDYGFELFCEPVKKEPLSVVTNIDEDNDKNIIYLAIDISSEPQKLKRMFSTVLKKHKSEVKPPESRARFQPSLHGKYIRLDVLKTYLEVWEKRQSGMTRTDIYYEKFGDRGSDKNIYESDLRVISRQTQRANEIFKNIEKGTFP